MMISRALSTTGALAGIAFLGLASQAACAAPPPSCTIENRPASVLRSTFAEYPALARLMNLRGTARVRVDLSATGRIIRSTIAASTGSVLLDEAALAAVEQMKFAPEIASCGAVPGSYAVSVVFSGD